MSLKRAVLFFPIEQNEVLAGLHAKAAQQARDMKFHRASCCIETSRDLFIVVGVLHDLLKDSPLGGR
jgi:hypothetical protein